MMLFVSALILGISSGLHCGVMCGPIMLAVMPGQAEGKGFTLNFMMYHGSRITAYACLGLVFGLIGNGIFLLGLQRAFSVLTILLLLASIFFSFKKIEWLTSAPVFNPFKNMVMRLFSRALKSKHVFKPAALGFLNGFIPCGIIYYALAVSMNTFHPLGGAFYMFLFGLGTIPVLFVIMILLQRSKANILRMPWLRWTAVLLAASWIGLRMFFTDSSWVYFDSFGKSILCN